MHLRYEKLPENFPRRSELESGFCSSVFSLYVGRIGQNRLYSCTKTGGTRFYFFFLILQVAFGSPGLKLATILDDPFVEASQLHVYSTHTRHITIQGHGFLSSFDPAFKPQVNDDLFLSCFESC